MPPVLRITPIANTVDASIDRVTSVCATHLDSHDDTDILGATQTGAVPWWENDGGEGFTKRVVEENFDGASSVYATDIDSDGDTDILAAAYLSSGELAWWDLFE